MRFNYILEIDSKIEVTGHKAEQATRHYPGCPAHFEVTNIELYGCTISEELFLKILKDHEHEILEYAEDEAAEQAQLESDARYDVQTDR